jgi:hypothetical protein
MIFTTEATEATEPDRKRERVGSVRSEPFLHFRSLYY